MADTQILALQDLQTVPVGQIESVMSSSHVVVWTSNQVRVVSLASPERAKVMQFSSVAFWTVENSQVFVVHSEGSGHYVSEVFAVRNKDYRVESAATLTFLEVTHSGFLVGNAVGELFWFQDDQWQKKQICKEKITSIRIEQDIGWIAIGTVEGSWYLQSLEFDDVPYKLRDDTGPVLSVDFSGGLMHVTRGGTLLSVIAYFLNEEVIEPADICLRFEANQRYATVYSDKDILLVGVFREDPVGVFTLEFNQYSQTVWSKLGEFPVSSTDTLLTVQVINVGQAMTIGLLFDGGCRLRLVRLESNPSLVQSVLEAALAHPDIASNPVALNALISEGRAKGLIPYNEDLHFGLLMYLFRAKQASLIASLALPSTNAFVTERFEQARIEFDNIMSTFKMTGGPRESIVAQIIALEGELLIIRDLDREGEVLYGKPESLLTALRLAKWFFSDDAHRFFSSPFSNWNSRREVHQALAKSLADELAQQDFSYPPTELYIDTILEGAAPPTLNDLSTIFATHSLEDCHKVVMYLLRDLAAINSQLNTLLDRYCSVFLVPKELNALVGGMWFLDNILHGQDSESLRTSLVLLGLAGSLVDESYVFRRLMTLGAVDSAIQWGVQADLDQGTSQLFAWALVRSDKWYLGREKVKTEEIVNLLTKFRKFSDLVAIPGVEKYLDGDILSIAKEIHTSVSN